MTDLVVLATCEVCRRADAELVALWVAPEPNGTQAAYEVEREISRLEGIIEDHPDHDREEL